MQKYEKDYLEATTNNIEYRIRALSISAVYCRTKHNIKKEQNEHFFKTLVGGDCHTKHPTLSLLLTTPKGRKFLAAVDTNSLHCLIKTTNI